jgi:Rrf2 family iron-sulfur cluster assembly transcriptional regulator
MRSAGSQGFRGRGFPKEENVGMKITTKGRYALRASLTLARIGKTGTPVSISAIAEQENISTVFLEQIFFKLRKEGIVASVRGPGGGVYFARPLDELTLKEILDAAGEELDLTNCGKTQEDDRQRIGASLSSGVWTGLTELINGYFSALTLASILEKGNLGEE